MNFIPPRSCRFTTVACAVALVALVGCSSTDSSSSKATSSTSSSASGTAYVSKAKADDGRTVDIGRASPGNGGVNYKDPHLEKCWVASGFDFNGYDTLYIAPTLSTAKVDAKDAEAVKVHALAMERLQSELATMIAAKKIFANVMTQESAVKPDAKTLKLVNTITEFSRGGGAARYFAGLYGAGQPVLRVQGKMTDGDKSEFTFEARRSGTSGGARMGGGVMKDEDIQVQDIHSMVLDLTDFMAVIAGKYTPIK